MKLTWKIWLLIIAIILSAISMFGIPPKFLDSGMIITTIEQNSSLFEQGLRPGQKLISIDDTEIVDIDSYIKAFEGKFLTGENEKITIVTDAGSFIFFGKSFPEILIVEIPNSNLKLGLDLAGGARALIKAENKSLSLEEMNDLVQITQNRLNAFGLTDLKVVPVSDLSGNNYMLIEIAGATPKDLRNLISKQGKFEAKIGNETVFEGGKRDIASVSRDAQNARIEGCSQANDGSYYCRFSFAITLSGDAAQKHADITDTLTVESSAQGNYLSEKLDLVLDDKLVDSLLISEGLKGRVTTQISISGSGAGATEEEAYKTAKAEMKQLQTILMTGSLPYKLQVVKLDTISPILGDEFVSSILIAGIVAILVVALIIWIRYKSWKSALALVGVTFSEVLIILGVASLIQWNLDLPGIAGILATIGTGIDDLIILMDETSHGGLSLKQRIKRAFAIILGAYFTSLVALLPLMWAGAGLLKGFAITTIIGISVGVFITRPAFGDMLRKFKE